MNQLTSTSSATARFWDKFTARLLKKGVNEKHIRWYVIRAD
jgi:hypothetical protein